MKNFYDIKELLFNNRTIKQTVFKNTFWLAFAEIISRILKLFLVIYVARILGAADYGKFNFGIAFVSLFAVFSDLGITSIITREFAREKEKEKEFSSLFALQFILSLIALFLTLFASFFITADASVRMVIWIFAVTTLVNNFSGVIYAFFRARQIMEYESWAKILNSLLFTGVGLFAIIKFPSVENLSYSYLFASVFSSFLVLAFFHYRIFRLRLAWNKIIWKNFLSMSWPIALAGIFGNIYAQTDTVMMGHWGQLVEVGWYNAASKIIGVTLIPMALISQSFYPVFSNFLKESKERLQKAWNLQMEIMIFIAMPLMVGGIVFAQKIINFIYGQSFDPSILTFQILIIMAGFAFLCNPFVQILIIFNHQKKIFWVTFAGALVNIILNAVLIPAYSLYGASVATVATYILIFFSVVVFVQKFTFIRFFNRKILFILLISVFSSALMYAIISVPSVFQLNIVFSVSLGASAYAIIFFILRSFSIKRIE